MNERVEGGGSLERFGFISSPGFGGGYSYPCMRLKGAQHKLTNTVGRSGTGRGSIYGGEPAKGRFRLGCGLAPRSKGFFMNG